MARVEETPTRIRQDDLLDRFLDAYEREPFEWGKRDCALVLADWWMFNGHSDPAAHLRGTYSDQAGCHAILRRAGGLLPIVQGIAARFDIQQTTVPERGCIAVIGSMIDPIRQFGSINDGGKWLLRHESKEFYRVTARPLGMWRAI